MGQQSSTLSPDLSKRLLKKVALKQEIELTEKKLEVRKSTNPNAGLGVFALEPIPKDAVFMIYSTEAYENKDTGYFINDLAYNSDCTTYETDDNITKFTNIGFIRQSDEIYDFFGTGQCKIYLYALRDIQIGEELSKYYSLKYWQEYEFWKEFPESQFRTTRNIEDLPSKWVFIDTIRCGIQFNHNMNLFAKKVNNKYFYLVGYGGNYYEPDFPKIKSNKCEFTEEDTNSNVNKECLYDSAASFIEVTKSDFSAYAFVEPVYDGMYRTDFLQQEYKNKTADK